MRLEVTRKSELALRALKELADRGETTKGEVLAHRVGTSPAFLAQALAPLVRARLLRSDPGPSGGYALASGVAPSVLDVVEAVEGVTSDRCVVKDVECADQLRGEPCSFHHAWSAARTSLLRELDAMPAVPRAAPRARRRGAA